MTPSEFKAMPTEVRRWLRSEAMVAVDCKVIQYFAGRDCADHGNHVVYDPDREVYLRGKALEESEVRA